MLNQRLRASLSVGFVSCCFALGFGISLLMRFQGKISLENDVEVKTAIASLESTDSKKIPSTEKKNTAKSIVIKAVGDVIPGTNYPNYRLPNQ